MIRTLIGKEAFPQGAFGLDIQCARQIIKDIKLWSAYKHTGCGCPLKLSSRQLDATRADDCLNPITELKQIFFQHRRMDGSPQIDALFRNSCQNVVTQS